MDQYIYDALELLHGNSCDNIVPEFPYCCSDCRRLFKQAGQFQQHQYNKHGLQPLLLES
jgi:hypothetical protein